ncbi:UNVERIFIED_CONTAM: hypothetical protein GTU68_019580, partial [Idotea baltica]|nr:hypothetical protein [Idotea baltica]
MNVAWGQAIDHDMTLTAETKLPGTIEDPRCCDRDADFPECFPSGCPRKDAFFALFKQNCLNVVRSIPGVPTTASSVSHIH